MPKQAVEQRYCEVCKGKIVHTDTEGPQRYRQRRFCSRECTNEAKRQGTHGYRRPKELVDIRFCQICKWIIPRRPYEGRLMYEEKKFCSRKCFASSQSKKLYKEDATDYSTLHHRVRRERGSASGYDYAECGKQAKDWAWTHGEDGTNPDHYRPMCRKCHWWYDEEAHRDIYDRITPYQLSDESRARKEERRKQWWDSLSPERKKEISSQAWETRRRNQMERGN